MKQETIRFSFLRNVEYDANDGKHLFRVQLLSEWLSVEQFAALMRQAEPGEIELTLKKGADK